MPLEILEVSRSAFRLRRLAESGRLPWVLLATTLSLWRRAHFRTWWSLFVAGAGEPRVLVLQSQLFVTGARNRSCFISQCSFRGRRSALDMLVLQISWQCCDPRCADFVAGAALCEPRSADFVTSLQQILWQAQRLVNFEAQISWQVNLAMRCGFCDRRSAL